MYFPPKILKPGHGPAGCRASGLVGAQVLSLQFSDPRLEGSDEVFGNLF